MCLYLPLHMCVRALFCMCACMHVCMSVYIRTYAHAHVYEHHFLPFISFVKRHPSPDLLHASDGITTDDEGKGKLTHLGRFASSLPLDMKLAMLIYHGILLGASLPLLVPLLLILCSYSAHSLLLCFHAPTFVYSKHSL